MTDARMLRVGYFGRVAYRPAYQLQQRLRDEILSHQASDALLLLEHPPVVTIGRNATDAGIVATPEWLTKRGVEVVETDRGGQVTLHAPGQLVGYPILDLNPDRRDIRRYVRDLEAVLIDTLADFSIEALHSDDQRPIGVWIGGRKVASIGVHLRRWVTTHGFALNLTTDLSLFETINPCGMTADTMTSVEDLTGARLDLQEVARVFAGHFADRFERQQVALEVEGFDAGSSWAQEAAQ